MINNGWPSRSTASVGAALQHDRAERAVRLWGAAEALRARFATIVPPAERADYERALAQARGALQPTRYEQGWREGEDFSAAEAVAYAVDADDEGGRLTRQRRNSVPTDPIRSEASSASRATRAIVDHHGPERDRQVAPGCAEPRRSSR